MSVERLIERSEESILDAVAKLRRDIDAIEAAVKAGNRVPSSITGGPHLMAAATDVLVECVKRQSYYDAQAQA